MFTTSDANYLQRIIPSGEIEIWMVSQLKEWLKSHRTQYIARKANFVKSCGSMISITHYAERVWQNVIRDCDAWESVICFSQLASVGNNHLCFSFNVQARYAISCFIVISAYSLSLVDACRTVQALACRFMAPKPDNIVSGTAFCTRPPIVPIARFSNLIQGGSDWIWSIIVSRRSRPLTILRPQPFRIHTRCTSERELLSWFRYTYILGVLANVNWWHGCWKDTNSTPFWQTNCGVSNQRKQLEDQIVNV